ncbi:MAG: T9SS type A sorting domain-containing protein [Flavobacteriales bacterium]|nr:T9SS type A sorting domain-containing protein [Flavobacteriales bacterium]
MARPLPLLLALLPSFTSAQYYYQDFDGNWNNLPYAIDTDAGNLWQVGPPQKTHFLAAYSLPNVIVTDTMNAYPTSNHSSFTIAAPQDPFSWSPVFFVSFYQKIDTDSLQDGGYIEVSWDNGGTWANIFEDWMMPVNIEYYDGGWIPMQADTLSNGQIGFSGVSNANGSDPEWSFTSICWTNMGLTEVDTFMLRFNFISDTLAEARDGWMIDNIEIQSGLVHPVADFILNDDYFLVAPNPMGDRTHILFDLDEEMNDVHIALLDPQGRPVRVLRDGLLPRKRDHIVLWRNELPAADGIYFIQARINDRTTVHKLMVHSGGGYLWGVK